MALDLKIWTVIAVKKATRDELKAKKKNPRHTYDEVIVELLNR